MNEYKRRRPPDRVESILQVAMSIRLPRRIDNGRKKFFGSKSAMLSGNKLTNEEHRELLLIVFCPFLPGLIYRWLGGLITRFSMDMDFALWFNRNTIAFGRTQITVLCLNGLVREVSCTLYLDKWADRRGNLTLLVFCLFLPFRHRLVPAVKICVDLLPTLAEGSNTRPFDV